MSRDFSASPEPAKSCRQPYLTNLEEKKAGPEALPLVSIVQLSYKLSGFSADADTQHTEDSGTH